MKTKLHCLVFLQLFLSLCGIAHAASITWTNTAGGNWNVPANWSPNQVPGSVDTALITAPGTYEVSLTDNESVSNLVLGADTGTLTLSIVGGTFTVNGKGSDNAQSILAINGGTVAGTGSIAVGGPLNWTGGSINGIISANGGSINVSSGSDIGNGGELINSGSLTWTPNSGPRTGGGTIISNTAAGAINVALNGNNIDSYTYGGAAAFYNAGLINISGSGQSGFITDPFFNSGTVNIESGNLAITGGGTETGNFINAAGTTLQLASTTLDFTNGSTLTGAGTNNFVNGTINFSGTSSATNVNWLLSGATLNLSGTGNLAPAAFYLNSGILQGSSPLSVAGPLLWSGGNISGIISAIGGSINVSSGSDIGNGGELINSGNLTWTPNSGPRTGGGTIISNTAAGVINVALNGNNIDSYTYGGPTAFYNAGLINVSGSGQLGYITDFFFNTGTVSIDSGTLSFSGGGTNSGTINAASGADLDFSGGTFTSIAGSLISGAGNLSDSGAGTLNSAGPLNLSGSWTFAGGATVNLTGTTTVSGNTVNLTGDGTVNFSGTGNNGSWQPGTVNLSNGILAGTTPVVAGVQLTWTGGSISGIISANGGSINVSSGSDLGNGGELINSGNLTWTPNSGPRTGGGTIISNTAAGVINVALNGNNIDSYTYGGATAFYNAGLIDVSGSGQSGFITDPFFNSGTVNIESGNLAITGGGTETGIFTNAAGTTLQLASSTLDFTNGSTLTGAGTNNFINGTVNFSGTSSAKNVNWLLSGATLNLSGTGNLAPALLFLNNGALQGSSPLSVAGPLLWSGGNISGIISAIGGSINVSSGSDIGNGGELINSGNLTWTPNSGPRTGGGTIISNTAAGVINVALNGNNIDSYVYGGPTAFYNAGLINVSSSGQIGYITDPFFNTGTVSINGGTLSFSGGGTNLSTINAASGADLDFSGGTFTSIAGSLISGAGNLSDSGGNTFNFAGPLNLSGTWTFASSATVNLTGTTTISGNTVNLTGSGTVNFNGTGHNGSWQPGTVTLSNGFLAGTTPVVAGGQLTWTGGSITGIINANGGSINVSAGSYVGNGGELINSGSLTWTPNSGPRTGGGTIISNSAAGVINVALNGNNIDSYTYGGATAFYNAGLINVSGSGQSGLITDPFFNTGTVSINSGTLSFSGGGTNLSTINAASGADLDFSGGTFTSIAGSLISGAGNLSDSGGNTFNFAGPLNLSGTWTFASSATVNLTGTTTISGNTVNLTGSGTVNFNGTGHNGSWQPGTVTLSNGFLAGTTPVVAGGQLTWTGGSITGIINANGGSINVSAGSYVGNGGELINSGSLTWTPNSGPRTGGGTIISNSAAGVINVALNGNNIDSYVYGGAAAFYNAGLINVSGSGQLGYITDPFFNSGTVSINSGTFSFTFGGTNSGTINASGGADLDFSGGTFTSISNSLISGAGNLSDSGGGGTFSFDGPLNLGGSWTFASSATINLTGSTTVSGNTVNLTGSATYNFNGTGNNGSWQPGALTLSAGTLQGSTPVVASGQLAWTGGSIYDVVQCDGGSINVNDSSSLASGELVNSGILNWTPNNGPRTGIGTVISNAPSGVINVALNGNNIESYAYGGVTAFYNAGLINVSGSGQSGSITDPFFNSGTLNLQSGTLNMTAGFASTNGTLDFGLNSVTSYGQLAVAGNIAINGTLTATANGYTPHTGDSFPLVNYDTEGGIFNTFNLPPNATWTVDYSPTAFSINVENATSPFMSLSAVQPPLPLTSGFEMLLLGPAGSNYTIQASTSLRTPNWTEFTNFTTTHTSFYITDTAATNYSDRFYRAYIR